MHCRPEWHLRTSAATILSLGLAVATGTAAQTDTHPDIALFFRAADPNPDIANAALQKIREAWSDSYASMLIDVARFVREGSDPRTRIIDFLERQTGESFANDIDSWLRWTWSLRYEPHPDLALFRGALFSRVDPGMADFFVDTGSSRIRLDEIQWGGVRVNGIPPLDYPQVVAAPEADYLAESDVVFGIWLNGEARAYPKRILGWHELARDRVGGVELTIIYCTLCGTVLPYESQFDGRLFRFGTSGLLYRSNKLFFDEQTRSLWSTLQGRPVVGPLANEDMRLRLRSSVTTTWGEWKQRHPDTTVLSIDTGYERDYGEGVAYGDYFATDELMFEVPTTDDRLPNKAEVLVFRLDGDDGEPVPVAIEATLLSRYPVYPLWAGGHSLVVITSDEGANRVYLAGDVPFLSRTTADTVLDAGGGVWQAFEDGLVSGSTAEVLPRISANRAFWFGWYAQFPDTSLYRVGN